MNQNLQIKSLENTELDQLYKAFDAAFADYETQWSEKQFRNMLTRRGYQPQLSFAAFDGGQIAAFTLNGVGIYHDLPTAYDTGTGTLKAYRGQGLAGRIFEHSLPYLKEAGVQQYVLEVLQHNTSAVSVYRKAGFEMSRAFNYYIGDMETIKTVSKDHFIEFRAIIMDQVAAQVDFWDFRPSWQNTFESIGRGNENFITLGAFTGENLLGYALFDPASGDVSQLAVHRSHRRKGIGTAMIAELASQNLHTHLKLINTDISCAEMTDFLASCNIPVSGKQFEMIKSI